VNSKKTRIGAAINLMVMGRAVEAEEAKDLDTLVTQSEVPKTNKEMLEGIAIENKEKFASIEAELAKQKEKDMNVVLG
jgi:hypothetical protein